MPKRMLPGAPGPQGCRPDYDLVPRTEVNVTRPALEKAGVRCECCRHGETLRVCRGHGRHVDLVVVLCAECRETGGLTEVADHRRSKVLAAILAKKRAVLEARRVKRAEARAFIEERRCKRREEQRRQRIARRAA